MKLRRPNPIQALLMVTSLLAFIAGGHLATTAVIDHQRVKRLHELTETALRRSEVAVNFGVQTLTEVARTGPMQCTPAALQALRLQVYQRSWVKDIRSVAPDGSVVCSAYADTLEFDNGVVARADMVPAREYGVFLFRMDQINGFALGVLKDIGGDRSPVAILGINSDVLDILPAELRDHGEILLGLVGGPNVGRFAAAEQAAGRRISVVQTSRIYPLTVTVTVDAAALAQWDSDAYWPAMGIAALLGLAFGIVLARAAAARGPVADLDRALARRQFRPFYQPIFDLKTDRIVGCEALARWAQPSGKVVPPAAFIPLAESSGRIEAMTWQILAAALQELGPRLREDRAFKLSVNIVPRHLLGVDFIATLRRLVTDARVSPRQIVLEVTEREQLPDLDKAAKVVAQLRDHGFRIAMDDVGVGHSGLSQMKGLGANTIKIDKFFVDTITRDSAAIAIVEMLVRLARDLGMSVVAEGIETPQQIASLLACGVDQGQGYIVAPPLPFDRFDDLIERRATMQFVEQMVSEAAVAKVA